MIGTILALVAAAVAILLSLIAVNIALFFELRSIIPPSVPGRATAHTPAAGPAVTAQRDRLGMSI